MTFKTTHTDRTGFSLIEVMVATLILLIIVLMIGDIFRQGTSSWDAGYARAEGGMIVRGVVGSIQRELSTAVDGRLYPGEWQSADPVDVAANSVTFVCLKESSGPANNLVREPWKVTYTWTGSEMTREAWPLTFQGNGSWRAGSREESIVYSEDNQEDRRALYSADFKFDAVSRFDGVRPNESDDFERDIFWNIPTVSITVELIRASSFSGLELRSWGPDGEADTDDDIIVQ